MKEMIISLSTGMFIGAIFTLLYHSGGWYWLVKGALGRQKLDLAQWKRETKSVLVLRVSTKLIDDSNVPSGCKYLIDSLKNEKLIVDDSRKWVRNSFDQRKTNKNEIPNMEITISSMDE